MITQPQTSKKKKTALLIYIFVCLLLKVWFQNRRSKERRMKDIGMNSARRHCFRTQRRVIRSIRPGQTDGIEESGDLSGHFGYFSGKLCLF